MSKGRLEGKVAIVTGGASGIGEAAVRLFADNGAVVVLVDIQDELGNQVAASIGHEKCAYKHCDVTDENQVKEAIEYVIQRYGKLDVLFSNAGILGEYRRILDLDLDELDRVMGVNLRGSAAMIKYASRAMVSKNTRVSIICTGSTAASLGGIGPVSYTASKHGVVGLVRAAASELGKHGIRVNCVSPYGLATPLLCATFDMSPEELGALLSGVYNLKGIVLKTSHIAEAALFLTSDVSAFISGENLNVDGGCSAVNHELDMYKKWRERERERVKMCYLVQFDHLLFSFARSTCFERRLDRWGKLRPSDKVPLIRFIPRDEPSCSSAGGISTMTPFM